ncbi:MAG: acyltransferase [Pseudomonadota bacterium]
MKGECDQEITLGEQMVSNLKTGRAKLTLVIDKEDSFPVISIGSFIGDLYLRLAARNAKIKIGNLRHVKANFTFYPGGQIELGDDTSINGLVAGLLESKIVMGKDCMLSHDIHMQPHNQHGIIDLETRQLVKDKRNIVLGDHVWIGRAVSVLPGVTIGNGSIVGANSVITKDVPENSAVAGYPAKLVRENCTWSRSSLEIDADATAYLDRLDTPD